jgi:hypothetical protein
MNSRWGLLWIDGNIEGPEVGLQAKAKRLHEGFLASPTAIETHQDVPGSEWV